MVPSPLPTPSPPRLTPFYSVSSAAALMCSRVGNGKEMWGGEASGRTPEGALLVCRPVSW